MILFNWVFYAKNHASLIWIHLALGFGFAALNFFIFRYMILKFNIMTPGRNEDSEDVRLYSKQDYRDKKAQKGTQPDREKAIAILRCVGGSDNIDTISNCQTRLRLVVIDPACVMDDRALKNAGALGVIRNGKNIQVVIGLSVIVVREFFEQEVARERECAHKPETLIHAD